MLCLLGKCPIQENKILNRLKDEEYITVSQPNSDIPVYIVQPVVGGKQRTLHRNLLLPLGFNLNEVEDRDEDIEMASPVEVKRSEPLTDFNDSSSTPISKKSSKLPETNDDVQESILEPFDSAREFLLLLL